MFVNIISQIMCREVNKLYFVSLKSQYFSSFVYYSDFVFWKRTELEKIEY